jgi:hypothetical protein
VTSYAVKSSKSASITVLIARHDVAPGAFDVVIPVANGASVVKTEVRASHWILLAAELSGTDDPRELTFLFHEVKWEDPRRSTNA